MKRHSAALLIAAATSCIAAPALAGKAVGVQTPSGKHIYTEDETFGGAVNEHTRRAVIEVAMGAGPEGNLGILLGALNVPFKRSEFYVGAGIEVNPARHFTGSWRYFLRFGDFRPYLSTGYLFNDTYEIGVHSHNVFAEIGHKWIIQSTHHLTVGIGLRRVLSVHVREDSILNDPDVDRELLDEQINDVMPRWLPTLAVRFSRAF